MTQMTLQDQIAKIAPEYAKYWEQFSVAYDETDDRSSSIAAALVAVGKTAGEMAVIASAAKDTISNWYDELPIARQNSLYQIMANYFAGMGALIEELEAC